MTDQRLLLSALRRLTVLSTLALCAPAVQALPDDREQPIEIDAARNEVFLNEDRTVYYGHDGAPAVITQGSLTISGDTIEIQRQNGEVSRISASGSPSTFEQQPAIDQQPIHGSAHTLTLNNLEEFLLMEEEAELTQNSNRFRGHLIEYDMASGRIRAQSRDDQDRINVILQPDSAK